MRGKTDNWRITHRGGNYLDDAWASLSDYRAWFPPKSRDKVGGFRFVIRKNP